MFVISCDTRGWVGGARRLYASVVEVVEGSGLKPFWEISGSKPTTLFLSLSTKVGGLARNQ